MEKIRLFFILAIIAIISIVVYYNISNSSLQEYKGVLVWQEMGASNHFGGFYEGK